MKRSDAIAALEAAVQAKTLDGKVGDDARKALMAVPSGVDRALVRKAYERFAKSASYLLPRLVAGARPEHVAGLVDAIRSDDSVYSAFLLASLSKRDRDADEISDEGLERFHRAADAVKKIDSFAHSATSRESAERVKFVAEDPQLVEAARLALEWRGKSASSDLGPFLWLATILAMDGSDSSAKALRPFVEDAIAKVGHPGFGRLDVLHRLLGYFAADSKSIAAMHAELERAQSARDDASPATRWAQALGLQSDAWMVSITVGTSDKPRTIITRSWPCATLRIEAKGDPCFKLEIAGAEYETLYSCTSNDLYGYPLEKKLGRPHDLSTIKSWLDEAAKKMKTRWRWGNAHVFTYRLKPREKRAVTAWAQKE